MLLIVPKNNRAVLKCGWETGEEYCGFAIKSHKVTFPITLGPLCSTVYLGPLANYTKVHPFSNLQTVTSYSHPPVSYCPFCEQRKWSKMTSVKSNAIPCISLLHRTAHTAQKMASCKQSYAPQVKWVLSLNIDCAAVIWSHSCSGTVWL